MAKYSKELVKQIAELIASDSYTVSEICKIVGIHRSTFHDWERQKPDFSDTLKKARSDYNDQLIVEARRSLMKKIKGYEVEETKTVYGPSPKDDSKPKIKEMTKIKKHFQPDTAAIIFTLTNKVPDEYKHRQTIDAKVDMQTKLGQLSEDQLNQIIDKVIDETRS